MCGNFCNDTLQEVVANRFKSNYKTRPCFPSTRVIINTECSGTNDCFDSAASEGCEITDGHLDKKNVC